MKSLFHGGQQFPIDQSDEDDINYIVVEFASPSGFEFIRERCIVDSGSTGCTITGALVERLGLTMFCPIWETK